MHAVVPYIYGGVAIFLPLTANGCLNIRTLPHSAAIDFVRLDKLKEAIDSFGGLMPLAMIKNGKTVDPQDDTSPKVCRNERQTPKRFHATAVVAAVVETNFPLPSPLLASHCCSCYNG